MLSTVASFLLKNLGTHPKQILSVPVVEHPRNHLNGNAVACVRRHTRSEKLSEAEVVRHEVRKAINGFRSASFDVY